MIFAGSIVAMPLVCMTLGIVDMGTTLLAAPRIPPLAYTPGMTTLAPVGITWWCLDGGTRGTGHQAVGW